MLPDAVLVLDRHSIEWGRLYLTASGVEVAPGGPGIALAELLNHWGVEPRRAQVHANLRSDDDLRCVLRLDLPGGRTLGLRMQRNGYATAAGIDELAAVEHHYASLGVPCPVVVPTTSGATSVTVDGWLCHVETWLEVRLVVDHADNIDEERLTGQLLHTAALACAHPGPVVSARSPWAFIDLFPGDDRNEADQAADEVRDALVHALPGEPRVQEWHDRYTSTKQAIAPAYRQLPEAVVQADLYWGNVLVDGEGNLAGLLDFNLAGMERCLNYLMSEALAWPDGIAEALSASARARRDDVSRRRLAGIGAVHPFTDAERRLAPDLYRLRLPVYWPVSRMLLREVDAGRAREVLDWIELESTRPDAEILALLP